MMKLGDKVKWGSYRGEITFVNPKDYWCYEAEFQTDQPDKFVEKFNQYGLPSFDRTTETRLELSLDK